MVAFMDDETTKFVDRLGKIGVAAIYSAAPPQVLELFLSGPKQAPESA